MIIWGWRTVTSTVGSGTFDCPNCGAGRKYARKRPRRFFTLYFIPVIPLKVYDEYIECQFCTKAWQPSTLEYKAPPSPEQLQVLYRERLIGLLGYAAASGDNPSEARSALARSELQAIFGDIDNAKLQELSAVGGVAMATLAKAAADLAPMLDDSAKEGVFNSASRVLAGGETPTPKVREAIAEIGKGLGLSPAHQAGLVAQLWPAEPLPSVAG